MIQALSRLRPGTHHSSPAAATKLALRSLARRHKALSDEIRELDTVLDELTATAAPGLLARTGVGTEVAGQLLVIAGDNRERLRSEASFAHLAGIEAGDEHGQVAAAWVAAQELRAIYRCRDRDHAATRLYHWTVYCIDLRVPELARLARTITTWRTEFLTYSPTGRISKGPTEAVNLLIKKILRVAHGFRNFNNYRLRLLLHYGITWQHHTPTLRGRPPRLAV